MKNIEFFWNIMFYGIYRLDVYLRGLISYLNPFNYVSKYKSIKKYHYQNDSIDTKKLRSKILGNRESGVSIIRSGALMGGLMVLLEYSVFNIIQRIINKELIANIWQDSSHFAIYLIIMLIPVLLINNYLLYKDDKYLRYFEEFDKLDNKKQSLYLFISFLTVLLIVGIFFMSFELL